MISALLNSRRETTPTGGKFYDFTAEACGRGTIPL